MSHSLALYVLAVPALGLLGFAAWRLREFFRRPRLLPEELALVVAYGFALGALVWLEAYLAKDSLLGFSAPWTWLTAAHFGAAGFGALSISALTIRLLQGARARRVLTLLLVLHPIAFALTAAGINGVQPLDEVGATVYLALFAIQVLTYVLDFPREGALRHRLLLGLALCVPVGTMIPAAGWAWALSSWDLEHMIQYHGLVNAIGHVGFGFLAFFGLRTYARMGPLTAPLSKLACAGCVGLDSLDRWLPKQPGTPRGLTSNFEAFSRPDFDPARLDPELIAFYEETAAFELDLEAQWHRPFRLGGALWSGVIARWLGQLGLPGPRAGLERGALEGKILDIDDEEDGRENVRAWVRVWRETQSTLYIAAYAEHVRDGVRYMNIAFPLPRSNMTSILHLYHEGMHGLALTSRHTQNPDGDQGVYLVRSQKPWRLPLDETITVYPVAHAPPHLAVHPGSDLVAQHEMWLFGLRFLSLRYQIRRSR